ncbi:MAG: carboxypeptidase-like regulatory domain-containing protein [Bacteroidota bacterium]
MHKFISALLIIATMTVALSCKETFTEEDALNAQQAIDLALYVFNQTDVAEPPITGAKVTLTQNGVTKDVTTDETGGALFPGMKVGDFIYRVEAANFVTVATTGTATPANFRQGQMTVKIGMTSTADADMAIIKGTVLIEKDVTNATKENVGVIDLYFSVSLTGGTRVFHNKDGCQWRVLH